MPTRREFITHAAVAGIAATVPFQQADATGGRRIQQSSVARHRGPRIKSVIRREETVVRHGVSGDCWHMSWGSDDRQYAALCDGFGQNKRPSGVYNSRLLAIRGDAPDAQFGDVDGYPEFTPVTGEARYFNFGTLAIDRHIYQYLSTFNKPPPIGKKAPNEWRFIGAKLIYSPDNGRTWCNQDGSTPVVWNDWRNRSRETMVFFEEPQEAFSLLTILQMGKNYEANKDGYVYVYAPNGNTEGTMNELVMFRVPKGKILDRSAYSYFGGFRVGGNAVWVSDIDARKPVHTFPRGWVNTHPHPYAWHPSVVYNAPLGVYMMANWGMGVGSDDGWFSKPSYLGLWIAANPWGPWNQIYEEPAWVPAGDRMARAFQPQIAPKWIAPDGKSFWLVWTDAQTSSDQAIVRPYMELQEKRNRNEMAEGDWVQMAQLIREYMPYYSFNIQRVDLNVPART